MDEPWVIVNQVIDACCLAGQLKVATALLQNSSNLAKITQVKRKEMICSLLFVVRALDIFYTNFLVVCFMTHPFSSFFYLSPSFSLSLPFHPCVC